MTSRLSPVVEREDQLVSVARGVNQLLNDKPVHGADLDRGRLGPGELSDGALRHLLRRPLQLVNHGDVRCTDDRLVAPVALRDLVHRDGG
jgi:hypothetical protein